MDETKSTKLLTKRVVVGVDQTIVQHKGALGHKEFDHIALEVPVALVYNGISHVVMMASPKNLALFAVGFSLSEGIIESETEIRSIEIAESCHGGIEVHVELSSRRFMGLKERRRNMTGRTGCGICGTEQLEEIFRPITPLPFTQTFSLSNLDKALEQMTTVQEIGELTGCTHAAVWLAPEGNMQGGCEDVGRHVALDKLLGLKAKEMWVDGAVLVSSRASYEMVQKSAMCGVEILFAVSAATSLAVEVANKYNVTLVGFCRRGRATIFTHPQRLVD